MTKCISFFKTNIRFWPVFWKENSNLNLFDRSWAAALPSPLRPKLRREGSEEPSFLEAAAQQVSVALDAVDGAMAEGWEAVFGSSAEVFFFFFFFWWGWGGVGLY